MDKFAQLAQALGRLIPDQTILTTAKVASVEGKTCTVDVDGLAVDGVFLRPTAIGDNKLLATPKVGSYVLLGCLSGDFTQVVVLACDEVEKVELIIGESKVEVDENGVVFNGGSLGGMVKVEDLVSRLNSIEKAFNGFLNEYKQHNHTHPQGATTGFLVPSTQSDIQETQRSDVENEKVKQ